MNIGRGVKDLRKMAGLTQEQSATLSGMTQANWSKSENSRHVSDRTIQKICTTFNVPVALLYVLGIEKEEVPAEKQMVYDILFPIIRNLMVTLVTKDDFDVSPPAMQELPFSGTTNNS